MKPPGQRENLPTGPAGGVGSPRINQADFVAVQQNTIVAIMSGDRMEECIRALASAGVDVAFVDVLRGEAGLRILDFDGAEHGIWAHLVRSIQKLGSASNERENFANAMHAGESVLILPVADDATVRLYSRILDHHGGRRIIHFTWYGAEPLSY